MDIKKTIDELRTLVSSISFNSETEQPEDIKFLDITDENGNILRVESEELVVGDVIKMVTDDVEVAIPETEMKLEDGRTIKTDIDSKIIEIIEVEKEEEIETPEVETEVAEVAEEEMNEVETPEMETETPDEIVNEEEVKEEKTEDSNFENRIADLENLIKELITNQTTMNEAQLSIINIVEEFGKTPVEDKVNLKTLFNKTEKSSNRDSALESIRNFRSKK